MPQLHLYLGEAIKSIKPFLLAIDLKKEREKQKKIKYNRSQGQIKRHLKT